MINTKPIGGDSIHNFTLRNRKNSFKQTNNCIFLNNGRNCLKLIFKELEGKIKRIFIPDYFCIDIINDLKISKKISLIFYKIDKNFDDDLKDKKFKKNDLILFVNYFGIKNNLKKAQKIKNQFKCFVVVDMVQDSFLFLKKYLKSNKNFKIDFIFSSFKKSFSIPNGSCLISSKEIKYYNKKNLFLTSKFDNLWSKGLLKKKKYFAANSGYKLSEEKKYLKIFKEYSLKNNSVFGNISNLSSKILKRIDLQKNAKIRTSNYKYFQKKLLKRNKLSIPKIVDINNFCPNFFPVFFKNKTLRDLFVKKLHKEKFYFPIHWKTDRNLLKKYNIKSNLYNLEISFIIDHRIDKSRIDKVCNLIAEVK